MEVGAVLLAAGSSSRLGSPKQLVQYAGESLVRRAVNTLIESQCRPVVVVLGANAPKVADEIRDLQVHSITNLDWAEGMSSSIRTGVIEALRLHPDLTGLLIGVCDQPLVTAKHLRGLLDCFQTCPHSIAAAQYRSTLGVPAVFGRAFFSALTELKGDAGARRVIRSYEPNVCRFPLQEAEFDVDLPEHLSFSQT